MFRRIKLDEKMNVIGHDDVFPHPMMAVPAPLAESPEGLMKDRIRQQPPPVMGTKGDIDEGIGLINLVQPPETGSAHVCCLIKGRKSTQ